MSVTESSLEGPNDEFKTFEELNDLVEERDGVLTVSMLNLRDAHGAGRLGVHVRDAISQNLRKLGLTHYPKNLPEYQEKTVRIVKMGSPVERLIRAAYTVGPANDEVLRDAAGGDAAERLDKIREIVGV